MKKNAKIVNQHPDTKIIVLVIFLALLWGGNSVSIKIGLQDIAPLALAAARFILALFAVGTWAIIQRIPIAINRGELVPLLCLSAIFLLQIISLNVGTQFTNASRSTILINTAPFFTVLFAHFWVPGDRLSATKMVGISLAFGGVLLTFGKNLKVGVQPSLFGDLVVLASGCLLGLRMVVTKLFVQFIHPYRLLVWMMIFSLPCFLGLSLLLERETGYQLSISSIVAILYQGVVVAGFCFVTWTSVLKKYSPSRLVVLFFATPLFGVLLSHLLLGDKINPSLIIGASLVAVGIYIVNRQDTRNTQNS